MSLTDDDPIYGKADAAAALRVTVVTMASWRSRGTGPAYIVLGRRIFYRESALREYLASQERKPSPAKKRDPERSRRAAERAQERERKRKAAREAVV